MKFQIKYNIIKGQVLYKLYAEGNIAGVGSMDIDEFREFRAIVQRGSGASTVECIPDTSIRV